MPKLIQGKCLSDRQADMVLNAYGYRWTKQNAARAKNWRGRHGAPTIPLVSDEEWLREHAFRFTNDGKTLMRGYAQPAYMAPACKTQPRRRRSG